MSLRRGNKKDYLLDSNGELNEELVRMYLQMMRNPSHFAENVIFTVIMVLVIICAYFGIVFLFGTMTVYIIIGFLALCYLIVRI